ncbi:metallophosphoesterase family protein [Paenibacillus sacheonensis]|uniref:Metallophosphoesterase n=1 Tax=Paenibacillus sacheonensis TaxID=742054 RepID=A0A7X5C1F7_9BACL|nr:metallophosphoesterase [Paenibacillus sacheonensis]MBM7564999.1 3',5'-cyclic AMP phosphodiesterase CpdA [Paenibacillus sacheonensis]NBC70215.1 metallophosphoesterase [Paenibacillus sacheonensis]
MRLVLMGDLHYHEIDAAIPGLPEARTAFYHTLLDHFMNTDADLHISLGDLTNFGSPSELREVSALLRREDRAFIHVLGNHDVYSQPREQVLAITGQQRYRSIDTDEAMLVFLDTAREMNTADWSGWMDDEQLHWLEERVEESGTKPLLVFGHHPVYQTTVRSEIDKGSIHPSIDMWRILNRKEGTGVYFNGHTHVNSIVARNNWTFVQIAACLDQPGFRIVELEGERLRISEVDMMDADMMAHAATMHLHISHFHPTPEARGQESDRRSDISVTAAQPR